MTPKTAFRLGIAMVLAGAVLADLRPNNTSCIIITGLGFTLVFGGIAATKWN